VIGEPLVRFAALRPDREADFQALLRIYTSSIPASERKREAALRAMLQRPDYTFLLARAGDTVAGFSILARISADAALLEYMAVDPGRRGCGIGTELFRESTAPAVIGVRSLLIEVDEPGSDAPERDPLRRRIGFYRRQGCRQIGNLAWRMPQVAAVEPPPMSLWLFSATPPASIEKSHLRGWLESIDANVYACAPHDGRIEEMLAALPEQVPVL
jgi:GNAT superfamily N-acetyltransferase